MSLPQCQAIVLHGRDTKGNRAGLVPPRRCRRVATEPPYCGLHAKNAEAMDLLRDLMAPGWELKVQHWEDRRRREAVRDAEQTVGRLAEIAEDAVGPRLARFFRRNRRTLAESLASA